MPTRKTKDIRKLQKEKRKAKQKTDLQRVKLALVLSSGVFWAIVIVSFLMTKGFSKKEVFQLIGGYYLLAILPEYPTGVIGDYFSHKISVISGYLLLALGMFYLTAFSPLFLL